MGASVSVVVPVLNGGERLLDGLARLCAELPPDAEVWLVDDGSTDGMPGRVRATQPQVGVLTLERTHGAAFARNQGLACASGEQIFCVDADVALTPGCLLALRSALRSADIVFPTIRTPGGEILSPRTSFARRCCLNSAVFGISRAALARMDALFDETIEIYGEDDDFFLRACRLGLALRHVPEAEALHPKAPLLGERHYYLTVRNAVYVWLKLRRLAHYWMPMDLWIGPFLLSQLGAALCNCSPGSKGAPVRYTTGNRLHLVHLFGSALAWNVRHRRATLAARRAFIAHLAHEDPGFQLA